MLALSKQRKQGAATEERSAQREHQHLVVKVRVFVLEERTGTNIIPDLVPLVRLTPLPLS